MLSAANIIAMSNPGKQYEAVPDKGFELNDLIEYPVAATLDFLTTVADSVTLGAYDLETKDVTSWVDDNLNTELTSFYEQNQELVQFGSFAAGMILPGMAALKMAKAASTAYKGQLIPNIYKRMMDYQKINTEQAYSLASQLATKSEKYKTAMSNMKWGNVGVGVAESAVFETGFALMMNQHAYLEEDYSPDDFLLGVALGSLSGPIRYMIDKHKLTKFAQQVTEEATKTSALISPTKFITDTRGAKLGGLATIYNSANNYFPPRSVEAGNDLIKQRETVAKGMKEVIESMMPDPMLTGNKIDKAKDVVVPIGGGNQQNLPSYVAQNLDFPEQYIYDVSPLQLVQRAVVKNANTYAGVKSFDTLELGAQGHIYGESIARSLVEEVQGEVRSIDPKRLAQGFGIPLSQTATDIPAGVRTYGESINGRLFNVIEVPSSKFLKKNPEFKKWFGYFAGQADNAKTPTIMRSADGHIKGFSTNPLKVIGDDIEATALGMLDPDFGKPAMGVDEGLRVLSKSMEEEHTFGVVIRQLGDTIIPSDQALLMMPASGNAAVARTVNRGANIASLSNMKFNPLAGSTAMMDKGWLEVGYASRNMDGKAIAGFKLEDTTNLYHLQALYYDALKHNELLNLGKVKGPRIYNIGKGTDALQYSSDKVEDIKDLLIKEKLEWAKKMIKNGNSSEQIAISLNLPVEDVVTMRASFLDFDRAKEIGLTGILYNTKHNLDNILAAKPMAVIGQHRSYGMVQEAAENTVLDRHFMRDALGAIVRENITVLPEATKANPNAIRGFLSEMWDEVAGGSLARELTEGISKATANVTEVSTRFTDLSQQTRHLGSLGDDVVTWNANVVRLMNKRFEKIHEVIDSAHRAVAQSRSGTMDFEHVRRIIQQNTDDVLQLEGNKILKVRATEKALAKNPNAPKIYAEYPSGGVIELGPEAQSFVSAITQETRNLYEYMNFVRKLDGLPPLPDKGLWLPYEAIDDKYIAFKVSRENFRDMEIITASSEREFKVALEAAKADPNIIGKYDIVDRAQANRWNDMMDLAAIDSLTPSDPSKLRKGIVSYKPRADASGIDSVLEQVQRHYWHLTRTFLRQTNPELFSSLRTATEVAESARRSAKGTIQQAVGKKAPMSQIIESALLNHSMMNSKYSPLFSRVNDAVQAKMNYVLHSANDVMDRFKEKGGFSPKDYIKLSDELAAAGVENPFKNFDDYLRTKEASRTVDLAQHKVAQASNLVTLLNLRLLDASHAILTVLSTPIVMGGLMKENKYPMKEFYRTAKWLMKGGPEVEKIMGKANELGYVNRIVAEFTDVTRDLHVTKGAKFWNKVGKLTDKLSYASDTSEHITREFAYAMAYRMGKANGITDPALLRSNAHAFVIRSMGNYNSRQRPTIFQGTLGGMIGLYQTFMLTMAQNVYRFVEKGDMKALGTLVAAQGGMFGLSSLPFYNEFNRYLGAYVLSDDMDVTSEVYNLFGGEEEHNRSAAEFILFGAPSALFQSAFFTRGELQPRTPLYFEEGVKFTPAIVDNAMRIGEFGANLVGAIQQSIKNNGLSGDMGRAAGQALALQYVWRPGARVSEAIMGRTYDGKGEVLNTHEFWTLPTITRLLSSRPLEEEVIKRARFNGQYYNQVDRTRRQKTIKQLRRLVSTNSLTEEGMASLNKEYLDGGGSPSGWISNMRRAMTEADTPTATRLMEHFKKNEAYVEIFEGY